MEPERWRQIEEIVQSVIDTDPADRRTVLGSACGQDAELRKEVESLLAFHEEDDFTSSSAVGDAIKVLDHRNRTLNEGRRIGAYRLLKEIGRGGMGTVYLAARADDSFQKQVAIKIIRRGLDTDDIISRFRGERQILATLDHPNITRLLDGGATEDGSPYFVMEYIEGDPVDAYCDRRKLGITDRLGIFQGVCAAVSYAHQNLVIHRDIKPSNVLVSKDGVPQLLDFGIAKLLASGTVLETKTRTGLRPLTPEYASPEQVRGEAMTTATDVYSLGILLYVLLTGQHPYKLGGASLAEIERAICEKEPEKPSAVAPKEWKRRLQGDLDNIVLMALRKEPQRRYASVEQFAEDIRRHLVNLPVSAQPDTWRYRAAKFVQRNKAWVAMAAIAFVSITGGIAASLWQTHVARQERDRARLEQAKADQIKAFLQETLTFASPEFASSNPDKNKDAKISEAMDHAARQAESELAGQPEVLAEIQATIGAIYQAQARYDQSESILRSARDKYIRLYGAESHEITAVSGMLANLMLRKGNYDEADALLRKNIDIERGEAKKGHLHATSLANALGEYGGMLDGISKPGAEAYLKEALQYAPAFSGKDRAFVAMVHNDLSNVAYRRGDLDGAERSLRAALDEYRKMPGGTYVEMGTTLSNLGAVLIRKGQYKEAEPVIREGLELRRKVLGDANPDTAMALYRLSDLLFREGKYQEAEDAANQSLAAFQKALAKPGDNPFYANPQLELGLILDKMGRPRDAETHLREALEIRKRLVPAGNQLIGITEGALGECLTLQKRYAEAEPLLLNSLEILRSSTVESDSRRVEAMRRLAVLYRSWGRPQEAARYETSPAQTSPISH
jgi:serine/threonine-protein kinase